MSMFICDQKDTDRKVNQARGLAHNNPMVALKMAKAIAQDPSLLTDLSAVVKGIVKHDEARAVMMEVAARPGIREKFKSVYNVIQRANIASAFQ